MAGRPRRPNTTNGRGGAREGAGRKPKDNPSKGKRVLSLAEIRKIIDRRAEEKGKTVTDVLLDMIYDDNRGDRERIAAARLLLEDGVPKQQEEKPQEVKRFANLPDLKPDPTKVIPMRKNKPMDTNGL